METITYIHVKYFSRDRKSICGITFPCFFYPKVTSFKLSEAYAFGLGFVLYLGMIQNRGAPVLVDAIVASIQFYTWSIS